MHEFLYFYVMHVHSVIKKIYIIWKVLLHFYIIKHMEYNWIGLEILENKHTLNFFF